MPLKERRAGETRRDARDQLLRFLTENYTKKGKPVPAFMARPAPGGE